MHALLAVHALMAALLALSLRVIHSTTSMLMFVFPAVLALLHALSELSLKADRITVRTLKAVLTGTAFLLPAASPPADAACDENRYGFAVFRHENRIIQPNDTENDTKNTIIVTEIVSAR